MLTRYKHWLAWFVASIFYLYEYTHRVSISVMIDKLSLDFHANSTDISNLSASYFYVYALCQIPAGFIVDKYSTRIILPLAAIITGIGCLIFAQTESLILANFARGLIGLGSAFAFISALKIASQQIESSKFALIVGLTNFLGAMGGILGTEPYLIMINKFGWRPTVMLSGYLALGFALVLACLINPKYNLSQYSEKNLHEKIIIKPILFNKHIWLIAIIASLMICPISTYTQLWGASFLENQRNLNLNQASLLSSVTFFGIAFGGPLIGYLNNYLRTKNLLYLGVSGALATLLLILFVNNNNSFYLALIHLLLGLFTSSMLLCFTLGSEQVARKHQGAVIGLLNAIITFIGASFQIIAGKIIEVSNEEILIGMLPLIACHVLCLILLIKLNPKSN